MPLFCIYLYDRMNIVYIFDCEQCGFESGSGGGWLNRKRKGARITVEWESAEMP